VIILTGGQTGVDRGAWRAARDLGIDRGGYMPSDSRDEDGPVPLEIARELKRCRRPGYPARTGMNVSRATGVLVVVANREQIQQIVLNLMLNAEHVLRETGQRGEICVRTGETDDQAL